MSETLRQREFFEVINRLELRIIQLEKTISYNTAIRQSASGGDNASHIADRHNPHVVNRDQLNVDVDDDVVFNTANADIFVDRIGTPTYKYLQDVLDTLMSSGRITGGVISDAGGETIDVASGTGVIKTTDSSVGNLKFFNWSTDTGLAIPTDTVRHIGIEYNAGSPQVVVKTNDDFDHHTDFHLGDVVNEGGTLHIQNVPHNVDNAVGHIILRFFETMPLERSNKYGGLILGESGDNNRYITVSAGTLWERITSFDIAAFDSSGASRFDIYHRDGGAGFTRVANQQIWDNDSYDNGNIVTMTNNKYAVIWFYLELDGGLFAQYGRAQYNTAAGAELESLPATGPDRLDEHAKLIGRIIFQKSDTIPIEVQSVFTTTFVASGVTSHTELSDIGSNTHPQIDTHLTNEPAAAITTHTNIAAAHHARYTDAEVDAIVLTHKNLANDHHTKYTDAEVDAIVLTHKNLAGAHHTKAVSGDIDHDTTNNFEAGEHFTMLDEDDLASDSDTKAATQQSIKAFVATQAGHGTGVVTAHSDVSDAGSGIIITGVERTALHAKYTDGEAVTAMGAKADGNALNHDRATPGGDNTDTKAIHVNTTTEISGVAEKVAPVSADLLLIEDSTGGTFTKKKIQIGNLPEVTKTYTINISWAEWKQAASFAETGSDSRARPIVGATGPAWGQATPNWAAIIGDNAATIGTASKRNVTMELSSHIPRDTSKTTTITQVVLRVNNQGGGGGEDMRMNYLDWDGYSGTTAIPAPTLHAQDTTIGTSWETMTFAADLTLTAKRTVWLAFDFGSGYSMLGGVQVTYTVA